MFNVEFIGLPGAGKSHIKACLVNLLKMTDNEMFIAEEEALLQVYKVKIDRMYRYILKCLPHSSGLKLTNRLANRSLLQFEAQNRFLAKWGKSFEAFLSSPEFDKMTTTERYIGITDFLHAGANFECINSFITGNRVVFFDEGFLQKSFMFILPVSGSDAVESNLISYLDLIPISNLVIHVNTDLHSCYKRMVSRERGVIRRLNGCNEEDILNFLKNSDNHIKKILQWIKRRKDIILVEIHNDEEPQKELDKLKIKIMTDFGAQQ